MPTPLDIGRGFEQRITKRLNDWWKSLGKEGKFERRGLGKKGLPDIICPKELNWCISCKAEKWDWLDTWNKGKVHLWIRELLRSSPKRNTSVLITTYRKRYYVMTNVPVLLRTEGTRFKNQGHSWVAVRLNDFLQAMSERVKGG